MALIGKIREKSALIVIIVGVALLAFILGDWKFISGASGPEYGIGTVDGEMIDVQTYNTAVQNFQQQDEGQARQAGREYGPKEREASETKAFNYTAERAILQKEFEALGIRVGDNEFDAYFYGDSTEGFSVLPELAQAFRDSITGQFSRKMLQQRVEQMQNSDDPQMQKSWEDSRSYYIEQREREKYFTILNQGVYVTKLEAKEEYTAQKKMKTISFVYRSYRELPDDEFKVTDEDMKKYFDEHKHEARFKPNANTRTVRYFDIAIRPSGKDSSTFSESLTKLKADFEKTKNDSAFVMRNGGFYTSGKRATAVPMGSPKSNQYATYPMAMDTVFKSATIGQIVGPYNDNGTMKVSKVVGFTPREITARHILLSVPQGDAEADARQKKLADSIMRVINSKNFEEFVEKYSEDPGSKATGGKYEDFLEGDMVPEFGTFAANEPIGKIGLVKTDFGYHIMEVLERSSEKYPVLVSVSRTLSPSDMTREDREKEADDLLYELDDKLSEKESGRARVAAFDTLAKEKGYFVRQTTINDRNPLVNAFETQLAEDKLIELAYQDGAEVGQLIGSPIRDKERYVIAIVSQIQDKDNPKWEDFEAVLKSEVIRDKKAEKMIKEMSEVKDLNALSQRFSVKVMESNITFANPQLQGAGVEPEIVGSLYSGIADGKITKPLKGMSGVFVIKVEKTTDAPATTNYDSEQEKLMNTRLSSLRNEALQALKEYYNVIDNRRFSRIGVRL